MMLPVPALAGDSKADILSFSSNGSPQFAYKSQTGHCYWDVCFCPACINDHSTDDQPDQPKKISSGKKLKKRYQNGDKQIGTLGQPSGKFDFLVTYSPPPRTDGQIIPTGWEEDTDDHPRSSPSPPKMTPSVALPQICMMSPANYEEEFPPLQPATTNDGIETRQPKVLNSRTVEPDGTFKRVAPAEAVLNWQSENLIAQNKVL
ncbi:hypothetical protein TIFTF001_012402 [Ficus carica]|uniref:Uncharacterized protein n=1 Tax=Ficus carica TaxID=3494 RepID=A0AA88AFU5_FICCA|nr:hypothetical protein TIFTF001_012402 [Ficus carica]